jgi:hypothetical protein
MPAKDYDQRYMRSMFSRRPYGLRLLASGFLGVLLLLMLSVGAGAARLPATAGAPCPLTAAELSTIVGKTLQRVNLTDPDGDPTARCAFSAVGKSSATPLVSPQVFMTLDPGSAADLRDLYLYYRQSRSKLAGRPRVSLRSDLGPGAFTLTPELGSVTTAYFLVGKSDIGVLSVDLADAGAGKRAQATADKIFTLVLDRLT